MTQDNLATLEYMLDRSIGNYNLYVTNSKNSTEFIKEFYSQMAEEEHKKIEALKWVIARKDWWVN